MRALVTIALACLAVMSFGQRTAAQKEVEKQIAKYCAAMAKKDVKGVQAIMTSDFTASNRTGMAAKGKDVIRQLGDLFYQVKSIKLTCTILSFKLDKGNARLVSRNVSDVEMPGPNGKVGKLHDISTSEELWVPAGNTYKVKSSKQLTHSATFNGKPVRGG